MSSTCISFSIPWLGSRSITSAPPNQNSNSLDSVGLVYTAAVVAFATFKLVHRLSSPSPERTEDNYRGSPLSRGTFSTPSTRSFDIVSENQTPQKPQPPSNTTSGTLFCRLSLQEKNLNTTGNNDTSSLKDWETLSSCSSAPTAETLLPEHVQIPGTPSSSTTSQS